MKFLLSSVYFAKLTAACLQICFMGVDGLPFSLDSPPSDNLESLNKVDGVDEEWPYIQNLKQFNWTSGDNIHADFVPQQDTVGRFEFETVPVTTSGYSYHHGFIIIPAGLIYLVIRLCVRAGCWMMEDEKSDREPMVT